MILFAVESSLVAPWKIDQRMGREHFGDHCRSHKEMMMMLGLVVAVKLEEKECAGGVSRSRFTRSGGGLAEEEGVPDRYQRLSLNQSSTSSCFSCV